MAQADVLTECQDYLLGAGDPDALTNTYADVVRELSLALPLWTTVRTIVNLWSCFALATDGSTSDMTAAAKGSGTPVCTTNGTGHLLAGTGKYDTVTYTVTVPQSGGTPIYDYAYWNGRVWLPVLLVQTPNFGGSGLQTLQIVLPEDWSQTPPTDITLPADLDGARFWLRVRALTAPTTAPQATVAVAQHTFPLQDTEQEILALACYPDDLTPTEVTASLDLALPDWRTEVGTPRMYHQDEATALGVRVVPLPATQGAANGLLNVVGGAPVDNNLVLCAAAVPGPDAIPSWLEGLVVLRLAAREAARLGEASAPDLSQALLTIAGTVEHLLRDAMVEELR